MANTRSNDISIGDSNAGRDAVVTNMAHEATVIARAVEREGLIPHLQDYIDEVLVKGARNARNLLTLNGARTETTRNTRPGPGYLVTTKSCKVIELLRVNKLTIQTLINFH